MACHGRPGAGLPAMTMLVGVATGMLLAVGVAKGLPGKK